MFCSANSTFAINNNNDFVLPQYSLRRTHVVGANGHARWRESKVPKRVQLRQLANANQLVSDPNAKQKAKVADRFGQGPENQCNKYMTIKINLLKINYIIWKMKIPETV